MIEAAQEQISQKESAAQDLAKAIDAAQPTIKTLQESEGKLKREANALSQQATSLKTQIQSKTQALKDLRTAFDTKNTKSQSNLAVITSTTNRIQQIEKELKKYFIFPPHNLQVELKTAKDRLLKLLADQEMLEEAIEVDRQNLAKLGTELSAIQDQSRKTEKALNDKNTAHASAAESLTAETQRVNELGAQKTQLNEALGMDRQYLSSLQEKAKQLAASSAQSSQTLDAATVEAAQFQQQIVETEKALAETQQTLAQVNAEIQGLEQNLQTLDAAFAKDLDRQRFTYELANGH